MDHHQSSDSEDEVNSPPPRIPPARILPGRNARARMSPVSVGNLFIAIFTTNPFGKVTNEGFTMDPLEWGDEFCGSLGFYSVPPSPEEAGRRIQENVGRFFGNYRLLSVGLFFIFLYQTPLSLLVVLSMFPISHYFNILSDKWGIDNCPLLREALVRIFQLVALVILYYLHVLMALFSTIVATYVAMMVHGVARQIGT